MKSTYNRLSQKNPSNFKNRYCTLDQKMDWMVSTVTGWIFHDHEGHWIASEMCSCPEREYFAKKGKFIFDMKRKMG